MQQEEDELVKCKKATTAPLLESQHDRTVVLHQTGNPGTIISQIKVTREAKNAVCESNVTF